MVVRNLRRLLMEPGGNKRGMVYRSRIWLFNISFESDRPQSALPGFLPGACSDGPSSQPERIQIADIQSANLLDAWGSIPAGCNAFDSSTRSADAFNQ